MFVKVVLLVTVLAVAQSVHLEYGGAGEGYGGGYSKETIIEYGAPPKYEYKYAVHDPHTGDQKEKVESRDGELTKSQYAYGEKDRKVEVARVISSSIPVKAYGKY